jgi:hypothetical protein
LTCPDKLKNAILDGIHLALKKVGFGDSLDAQYWSDKSVKQQGGTVPVWGLKKGVSAAQAIQSVFQGNAKLECAGALVAVTYYAILKACGEKWFDKAFASGNAMVISPNSPAFQLWKEVPIQDMQAGDYVYFRGHPDYESKEMIEVVGPGYWRGENAIVESDKKHFSGLGVNNKTEKEIKLTLLEKYNVRVNNYNAKIRKKKPSPPPRQTIPESQVENVIRGIIKVRRINYEHICLRCCQG